MISWISQNWGTIAICIFLAAVVIAILSVLIKDKKNGRSSCGGNCSHCGACGNHGSCGGRGTHIGGSTHSNCGIPATPPQAPSQSHHQDTPLHTHILSENPPQKLRPRS